MYLWDLADASIPTIGSSMEVGQGLLGALSVGSYPLLWFFTRVAEADPPRGSLWEAYQLPLYVDHQFLEFYEIW